MKKGHKPNRFSRKNLKITSCRTLGGFGVQNFPERVLYSQDNTLAVPRIRISGINSKNLLIFHKQKYKITKQHI